MLKMPRVAILALMLLPLAGCKLFARGDSCDKPGEYVSAQNMPPLKVPAGLDAPDTRASLPVPDLAEPERPRKPGDPCLDAPPPYSPPTVAKPVAIPAK
jgi:uncharacterized lipoprotein